jgi:hypothetical protein
LSDELDIVGAGVAVLVGEVEADPQATSRMSTGSIGSGENRLAEAVWRNPAAAAPLVIGARGMWERILDSLNSVVQIPQPLSSLFNMRSATGAHNQELVGAPDQGVGSSGPETESLAVGRPLGQSNIKVFFFSFVKNNLIPTKPNCPD